METETNKISQTFADKNIVVEPASDLDPLASAAGGSSRVSGGSKASSVTRMKLRMETEWLQAQVEMDQEEIQLKSKQLEQEQQWQQEQQRLEQEQQQKKQQLMEILLVFQALKMNLWHSSKKRSEILLTIFPFSFNEGYPS
jgi:hypothetical protein